MPPNPPVRDDIDPVDYEYTQSLGAHGVHAVGVFDALVGSQREIWISSDGSGLIRSTSGQPASLPTKVKRAGKLPAVRSSPTARASIYSHRDAYPEPVPDAPGSPAIRMGSRRASAHASR
jgi:hypothetical protein